MHLKERYVACSQKDKRKKREKATLLSGCKMTLKQQLNGEKRRKVECRTRTLICFWLSCAVFVSSAWNSVGMTKAGFSLTSVPRGSHNYLTQTMPTMPRPAKYGLTRRSSTVGSASPLWTTAREWTLTTSTICSGDFLRHPTRWAVKRPTNQTIARPTNQPSDQPTDPPTNQPTGQPTDPLTSQLTSKPTHFREMTHYSITWSTNWPADRPTNQPTDQATDPLTSQPTH